MKISQIEVDQYGRISGGGIHDAVVQGFCFIAGKSFDVSLQGSNGESLIISLSDVALIGLKEIVNGTIISDVFCWELGGPDDESNPICEAWRVLLGGNYIENDFERLVGKLKSQYAEQLLVFFESSYGGSIAAISREIDRKSVV